MSVLDYTCCQKWTWRVVFCLLDNVTKCRIPAVCDLHDRMILGWRGPKV